MFLDVHLMIDKPVRYIEAFARAGADLLSVHLEADRLVYHQMDIQEHVGALPDGGHHRHSDRDIGDESAVHHVHMEIVGGSGTADIPFKIDKVG